MKTLNFYRKKNARRLIELALERKVIAEREAREERWRTMTPEERAEASKPIIFPLTRRVFPDFFMQSILDTVRPQPVDDVYDRVLGGTGVLTWRRKQDEAVEFFGRILG